MEFIVFFADGRSFGPADVPTLSQWAREGRLLPDTILENMETRQRLQAGQIAGIFPAPAAPSAPGSSPFPPQAGYNRYPPGYQQGYNYSPPISGMAIAALVLGILSLTLFCFWPVAVPLGILAAILGALSKGQGRGLAIAGIVCGIVGALVSILIVISFISSNGRFWFNR